MPILIFEGNGKPFSSKQNEYYRACVYCAAKSTDFASLHYVTLYCCVAVVGINSKCLALRAGSTRIKQFVSAYPPCSERINYDVLIARMGNTGLCLTSGKMHLYCMRFLPNNAGISEINSNVLNTPCALALATFFDLGSEMHLYD